MSKKSFGPVPDPASSDYDKGWNDAMDHAVKLAIEICHKEANFCTLPGISTWKRACYECAKDIRHALEKK